MRVSCRRPLRLGWWAAVVGLTLAGCGPGASTYRPNVPTPYKVVLVTFDGVRWQDFFGELDPLLSADPRPAFSRFWAEVAPSGRGYGNLFRGAQMRVANGSNASLPGYMALYAEEPQGCVTNGCGPIAVPTFLDRLHDELELPASELAVFAAWPKLKLAATGRDEVAQVRAGDFGDPPPGAGTLPLDEGALEHDLGAVLSTFEALRSGAPRFLHLALVDSDRYGHQGDAARYVRVLRAYDELLVLLSASLDAQTALVVTTDHGRGIWEQWSEHGPHVPASARIWAFVRLPSAATDLALVDETDRPFDHHDVRYTIETLFGLSTGSTARFSRGFLREP